ncbi:hypothetical protein pb186bvf_014575 [Paramecium bursaria]
MQQILDHKPHDEYIIKPTQSQLLKNHKKLKDISQHKSDRQIDNIEKFQQSLLSVNSQKIMSVSSQHSNKRTLLKSLKGGPLIPVQQNSFRKTNQPLVKQLFQIATPKEHKQKQQTTNSIKTEEIKQEQPKQEEALAISIIQPETEVFETPQQLQQTQSIQQETQQPEVDKVNCMVEQYMSEQEGWIAHLSGKCICVQCPCGRCKCKYSHLPFNMNLNWNSSYRSTFRPSPIQEQDIKVNSNKFQQFKSQESCDYKTTSMDYKQFQIPNKQELPKKEFHPAFGQTPNTSYKNQYMDYGNLHYEQFKQSHYKTVINELPFMANTTYSQNYKLPQISETKILKPSNNKPFPTIDLFLGQSTSKFQFPPKSTERQKPVEIPDQINMLPAYEGQYVSTTHSDFKKKDIICLKVKQ